jgi:release factor glutamine methyltransferase
MDLYLEFNRELGSDVLDPLRELVKRRAAREPLQHILGTVEFHGRVFASDRRALIPRPETEQLCELLLGDPPPRRFVDVGTGSGVIALTLAGAWPEAEALAVDQSENALALARENAARLGLAERVHFQRSDLLAEVTGDFDLVVANLPYIASAEIPKLAAEVLHDPASALDGGSDGTALIRRLIAEAPRHLRGRLALEIGHGQAAALREELARHNFQDIRSVPDYQGRDRFLFATHG